MALGRKRLILEDLTYHLTLRTTHPHVHCHFGKRQLRKIENVLADLDLNLLKVFDALLEEGSVTGAASRLHLSVPATSRALGRLRRAMGDPIFVRAGRGLAPTPFAVRVAPQVAALINGARALLTSERSLDLPTLQRTFTIRINDGVALTLAPELITRITVEAPNVTVRFLDQGTEDVQPLRDGTIDLDIGVLRNRAPDLCSDTLYSEQLVGVVAARSWFARTAPTLHELAEQAHISASRRGQARGPLDDALDQHGLRRRVVAVVPSFAIAVLLASRSELVTLVSPHLAAFYATPLQLRSFAIPVELPPVEISQQWHTRLDTDPAQRWLRDCVRTVTPHTQR